MIQRKAKKGRNAGGYFYGCSRFPKCRGTVAADEIIADIENNGSNKKNKDALFIEFPRILQARSRFQGYQSRFHECTAVSSKILEIFTDSDSNLAEQHRLAQWRMDFPIGSEKYQLNKNQRKIMSVMEKILTRGRITMLSYNLEKKLNALFNIDNSKWILPQNDELKPSFEWFDSKDEELFYDERLPKLIAKDSNVCVIPQVEFRSLVPSEVADASASRTDFTLFLPWNSQIIVVEIDGAQHKQHIEADNQRDSILERNGITVIRIPVEEVRVGDGPNLFRLGEKLIPETKVEKSQPSDQSNFILSCRIAHQVQLTLLQAIVVGNLDFSNYSNWSIVSDLNQHEFLNNKLSLSVLKAAVFDFITLFNHLKSLYKYEINDDRPDALLLGSGKLNTKKDNVGVIFAGESESDIFPFYIENIYVPFHISSTSIPITVNKKNDLKPSEEELEYFLKYLFRKQSFWEGQFDSISRALAGEDSLILLPTGAGKSIIYQLASLLLPGRTIVIDPIISLIEDQMDNLRLYGIDRCIGITSQIIDAKDRSKSMQLFGQGEYLFAFIAPERFQTTEFRDSLRTLTVHTPISTIVVDEAHCVSEWGHDFRTAYLNIGRTSREYCETNGIVPPLLALTGTASRAVLKDVQRELKIEDFDAIVTPKSFDRPELNFRIISAESDDKGNRLKGYLGQALPSLFNVTNTTFYQPQGIDTFAGIVFCPWVNGEFGVTQIANEITHELGIKASHYSGKTPKGWDSIKHRLYKRETEKNFKRNHVPLLVSTKAFGMGIDKPNIRYTIHYGIPPSIESFYQEAGRAGRDRRVAQCCIIVSNDDDERSKQLLNPATSIEQVSDIINSLEWEQNDDVTRDLFFHSNSFKGIGEEKRIVDDVIEELGDISVKRNINLTLPDHKRNVIEKALHRLLIIGVISDYTINYSNSEFSVKVSGIGHDGVLEAYGNYIGGYLESRKQTEVEKAHQNLSLSYTQFVSTTIDLLLKFIYDVIERGRRRALLEMLLACTTSTKDVDIRGRILRYLEATEYSEKLEKLLADEAAGFTQCKDIFSAVRSPNEAAEIRGQTSRYLESYPDHPGLLMLRFLSELYTRDTEVEIGHQNFQASIKYASESYGIDSSLINQFGAWAISKVPKQYYEFSRTLVTELIDANPFSEETRELAKNLPISLADLPAWQLIGNLNMKCDSLLKS